MIGRTKNRLNDDVAAYAKNRAQEVDHPDGYRGLSVQVGAVSALQS
jgi:hypothetical protein